MNTVNKNFFVKTTDAETAEQLKAEGFQLISKEGNTYTFLNKTPSTFNKDNKKISYSNILTM